MNEDIIQSFWKTGTPVVNEPNKRIITLQEFTVVINDYLNRGYCYGREEGLSRASAIVEEVFNH